MMSPEVLLQTFDKVCNPFSISFLGLIAVANKATVNAVDRLF